MFSSIQSKMHSYNVDYLWYLFRKNPSNEDVHWLREDYSLTVLNKFMKHF